MKDRTQLQKYKKLKATYTRTEGFVPELSFTYHNLLERAKFWGYEVDPPPRLTSFERVMFHFQQAASRARHCANPDCQNPYFFAAKKGQKYCSTPCAAPAQKESKRRWWDENRAKH